MAGGAPQTESTRMDADREMTRPEFEDQMRRMRDLKAAPESLDGHWDALWDIPDRKSVV